MAYTRRRTVARRPRRRTYKRRTPMRYTRRKTRLPKDGVVIPRNPFVAPFKQRHRTTLRYNDALIISPPIGDDIVSGYAFRTSSIYDPDQSSFGHQPYGRDQISPYYVNYQVMGARISVTVNTSNQDNPIVWGITMIDTAASVSGLPVYTMQEYPNTVSTTQSGSANADSTPTRALSMRFSPTKWFAISKTGMQGNTAYSALMGANPQLTAYWQIWYGDMQGGTPTGSLVGRVTIEYDVLFSNPIYPAASS